MEDILPVSDPFEVLGAVVARIAVDVVDLSPIEVCVCMPSHCDEPVNVERLPVHLCRNVMRSAVQSHERLRQELGRQDFADTPPVHDGRHRPCLTTDKTGVGGFIHRQTGDGTPQNHASGTNSPQCLPP